MDTYLFPPKTTILGLVGAACGWEEKEVLESIKIFKYGVIIESFGEVFKETAAIYYKKDKPIYPITKNMIYRPAYTVFLYSEKPKLIEEIEAALKNPKFVLALGDSENLFYPKTPDFVKVVNDIEEVPAKKLKCILPSKIYNKYCTGANLDKIEKIKEYILPPKEIMVPVDFTGSGKKRQFISENVVYYSGIEIHLKNPIEKGVFKFDGDFVYLF